LRNKGPLLIVPWRCTFACDSACVHCTSAQKPAAQDEVSTEDAKKIVDKVADFGATFFGITGGQPFLRKDLFEVLDYATQKGLSTSIIIDGRLLDEKRSKILSRTKQEFLSALTAPKTNDAIRGKGAYKAAISAIERFASENTMFWLHFANAGKVTNANVSRYVRI
jgi:MoaA/NifB/PqqE/SkfB family radical SAM enzyme